VLLVLPLGLSDGGYFGHSFTALTLALATTVALVLVRRPDVRLSRTFVAVALALALLSAWVALSSLWAVDGSGVAPEARRCVLYAVALVAVGLVVDCRRRPFLLAVTAAVASLAVVGICMRSVSGIPVDPYYGSLLAEPVGYPNAVGVLVAMGAVLSIGLATTTETPARLLHGVAALLILVLGLSGSRGGAVALAAGVGVLVALTDRRDRWSCVGRAASALVVGGGAWGLTVAAGAGGVPVGTAAVAAAVIGAAIPTPGRRGVLALLCVLAVAAVAAVVLHPPSTTSSYRSAYWAAAVAEARERPLLGSGAGSFYLSWLEHRSVATDVRDAHNLYVETLSELGPVGLALVLVVVGVPLGTAVRRRGDPMVATAAAGFAVFALHAGLDWDWEMPVVTLVALGCGGIVLAADEQTSVRRTK
jgi:O-antigen ligase